MNQVFYPWWNIQSDAIICPFTFFCHVVNVLPFSKYRSEVFRFLSHLLQNGNQWPVHCFLKLGGNGWKSPSGSQPGKVK